MPTAVSALESLLESHPNRPKSEDGSWDKLLWTPVPFSAVMAVEDSEDGDDNKLTFSFASEEVVARWFGTLTLSCKRGALLDERVKDNAVPFVFEHIAPYDLGMVRKVWLQARVAYTTIEFNGRMDSQEIKNEMQTGMRPNVSPLAVPLTMDDITIIRKDDSYNVDITYNKWQAFEISTVSMPANSKVGVGAGKLALNVGASALAIDKEVGAMVEGAQRRIWQMSMNNAIQNDPAGNPLAPTSIGQPLNTGGTPFQVPEGFELVPEGVSLGANGLQATSYKLVPKAAPAAAAIPPVAPSAPAPVSAAEALQVSMSPELQEYLKGQAAALAVATERSEILTLAVASGNAALAQEFLDGKETGENIRAKLVSLAMNPHMMQGKVRGGEERFSLARMVRAKVWPENTEYQRLAQFELESSTGYENLSRQGGPVTPFKTYAQGGPVLPVSSLHGISNRGERIPPGDEQLAVTVAGTSGAINAVVTAIDLDRTVDFLVEDSDILMKCDVAMGLVGNVQIPVETGGATIGFTAEGAVQAESVPTYTHADATPKQMSAHIAVSKQAIIQTSGWIERRMRMLLARQFRSQINYYLINGTGANGQPLGLVNAAGLPARAAPGTLATLNWDDVVSTEEEVDNEWVPEMGRAWVMGNAAYKKHLVTEKATNTGIFLLEKGQPLMSYDAIKSSFMPEASTTKGHVMFGNFLDLFVGFWDGFETVVEGITAPNEVNITVIVWWDTIVQRIKSFLDNLYT